MKPNPIVQYSPSKELTRGNTENGCYPRSHRQLTSQITEQERRPGFCFAPKVHLIPFTSPRGSPNPRHGHAACAPVLHLSFNYLITLIHVIFVLKARSMYLYRNIYFISILFSTRTPRLAPPSPPSAFNLTQPCIDINVAVFPRIRNVRAHFACISFFYYANLSFLFSKRTR